MLQLQQPKLELYRAKSNLQGSYTIPKEYEETYKRLRSQLHYLHLPIGVGMCEMYKECYETPDSFLTKLNYPSMRQSTCLAICLTHT